MPATAPIDGAAPAWTLADHAPHPAAARRRPSRGIGSGRDDGRVLVVGGGLAGCAVAASLAALGRACTVLDGRGEPAGGASGNPAGLFHGIVTPDDGVHARWYRTAALLAQRRIGAAIATGEVPGALCGVLRLQRARSHGAPVTDAGAMRSMLARLRLPPGYVQALDGPEASARSGVALNVPAWWYPGGGWVDPAAWCRAMLRRAAPLVAWQGDVPVDRLLRTPDGWRLLDAAGNVQGEAATVVLANAGDAWRLLGDPPWPVQRVRGQLSVAAWPSPPGATMQRPLAPDATDRRAHGAGSVTPGPAVALTGAGYLLPPVGDRLVFGATAQPGDDDPNVRPADHRENLQRLHALLHGGHGAAAEPGQAGDAASDPVRVAHAAFASGALGGRTAWRWSAGDRLPAVGAVPDEALAPGRRPDQARHVPRLPGLYVCTALGGRGITSAALAGDLLAAVIVGAPLPVPADLADAVDPARFAARAARRAG